MGDQEYAQYLAEQHGIDRESYLAKGLSDKEFIDEFGSKPVGVEAPAVAPENEELSPLFGAGIGAAAGYNIAPYIGEVNAAGYALDKVLNKIDSRGAPKAPVSASTMIPVPKNLPTTEFPSPELQVQPKEYVNPHGYGEPATKSAIINQDISDVHSGARATGTMGNEAPRVEGFNRQHNNRLYTPQGADIAPTPEQLRAARQVEMDEMRQKAMDKIQRANLSEAAKQEARRAYLAQEGSRRALESSTQVPTSTKTPNALERFGKVLTPGGIGGKLLTTVLPMGALAGAGAEGVDAWNRASRGDYLGAGIGGLGALGSAVSIIPTPMTRGIGTALSLGAPALNYGIDKLRGAPVKKADGGGIRLSQDDIIRNAINKPSRVDVLKRMGSDLGDQLKKEWAHPDRQMAMDLTGNVGSDLLGMTSDMVHGMANVSPIQGKANPFGSNSYDAKMQAAKAKMEAQRRGQIPMLGSANLKHQLEHSGITSGTERPATELALSFAGPWALEKAPSLLAKTPEMLRALEYHPAGMSIKNVGGQWDPLAQADIENKLSTYSTNPDVSNWASTTGRKYILNRLGSPQDEIKQLYDQGISHLTPRQLTLRSGDYFNPGDSYNLEQLNKKRVAQGFPEAGDNPYENVIDAAISPRTASNFQGPNQAVARPDWVEKLDPSSTMYTRSNYANIPWDMGIDKLTGALEKDIAAGKLRPEQLNKVSIEDAVRRAHQQRVESEAAAETAAQAVPRVREYPEGYAWHELTHEDPATLTSILKREGDTMQNCIGGYCDDVMEGGTKLYSLRDAKGEPHVNVEVRPSEKGPIMRQVMGKQNEAPSKEYLPFAKDFAVNPVGDAPYSSIWSADELGLIDANKLRTHGIAGKSMSPYFGELDRIFPTERGVLSGPHGVRIPSTTMLKMATQDLPGTYVTPEQIISHLATQEARPLEQSYSRYYENLGLPHMAGGRLVESFTKIPEAYRKAQAMIEAENNRKKFSQVLVPHEGSYLGLTQSDNFGIHGDRFGGTQFPMFQQFSPIHKDNKVVWMNDTEAHANAMAKNSTYNNKPVVWSNYIGSPDQLRSNKSVFQDVMDAHYNRDLSPEQIDLINARIKALSKGNAKKPVFQEPFDIRDKFAVQELGGDTFGGRRTLVNMLGEGEGVNKTKSGIILPNLPDILASHRDPITEGVGTSSIGSRLFKVDPTPSSYSKEYHPDYNWTVHGEDLNQPFDFTPHSVLDWYDRQFNLVNKKGETGKVPHGNSWFNYMNNPQFIDEKFIRKVEDAGYATGGQVPHMAGGKSVAGALEAVANAYKKASAVPGQYPKAAETLAGLNLTNNDVEAWRTANQFGGRQVQHPMLKTAANDLLNGKINSSQYRDLATQYLPIKPLTSIPEMPSHQDIASSLSVNKLNKGIVGYNNHIPDGTRVASRLDIPSYDFYNKWIVSLHDGTTPKGKSVGYGQTASLKSTPDNPIEFYSDPKIAADIAAGRTNKTPIARIHGDWENHDSQALHEYAQTLLDHPDWVQVGMNPYRHSYFYDKADMMPLTHAEEVIQIGPLVLAKKPVKTTPDDPRFRIDPNDPNSENFKQGGLTHLR